MVANKWNNPNFLPVTSVKNDTHCNFARPILLSFETVSTLQPATMEKVEEKWDSSGIQRWERSGQGDGGFDKEDAAVEEDEDASDEGGNGNRFGRLKKWPQQALDLRRNFFDGKSTYLLYLWEMLEDHNLFQSSMQQLHENIGSGDGSTGVLSIIGAKR
jgi:hypothetical protein